MTKTEDSLTRWHRISPLSVIFILVDLLRQIVGQGLPALIVLFAGAASTDSIEFSWIVRGAIALFVLGLGYAGLAYLRFRYRLSGDYIILKKGVLHREKLEIEFSRVQNVTIKEPFYMRPFNLAVLGIDTAGSQSKEIKLGGIELDIARELRSRILSGQSSVVVADNEVETVDSGSLEPESGLLLELSRRDVLIYGLTANFMLWALVAIGAVFGTGDAAERMIGWVFQQLQLDAMIETIQNQGGLLLVWATAVLAFLVLFMLLPLLSVVGALFRYDGYKLTVQGETYRKSSGLLTRHDESLKQHKIQAVVLKQNAIARFFRRVNIQLRQASAGSGIENGQLPSGFSSQFMVPSLNVQQAETLTQEFLPQCQPGRAEFSSVHRRKYVMFNLMPILLPVSLVLLILGSIISWYFFILIPLLGTLLWAAIDLAWKRQGYGIDGEFGFIRTGFVGTVTTAFPLYKVQRVDIRQTPWQQRAGIAHLIVHLASHSLTVPYLSADDARKFRDLALYHAESSQRAWF